MIDPHHSKAPPVCLARTAIATTLAMLLAAASFGAAADDGVSPGEIHIGTSLAVTGPIAVCAGVGDGANAYFKKVNDAGGVNGRKIKFTVLDDAYSTQRAIGNVRRLMSQDKVFAIFSGCGTATGAAVLSVVEKDSIPYLFPQVGLDSLVQPVKKNVYSILPLYGQQLATAIDYAAKSRQPKTAAISMINIAGHEGWTTVIKDKLKALNIQVVDEQLIEVTSPEKATFVTQMKAKNPDMVVMVDSAPGAARYVLEMQRQGWKPKVITGINTLTDEAFLRAAGNAADDLVIAPAATLPPTEPNAKECVDALAAYDKSLQPSGFTMFGCLGAKMFVDALKRVGPEPTRAGLIAELDKTKGFESGFSGPISFSPTVHQGLTAMYPIAVQNGQFKVIGAPVPLQ
ncbi:ABC transporter substrate-binding protein [Variovorax sp. PBL-E5]|uniref:ABC transporter substrate-binding protein n=1 Tax=Variovorax sp. PBL-E5 TaxID=434014 RepID=UPI0013186737|nr:ABC transporter substrate-binding protein [Variovorax sp. PBL-E5]VTU22950.1 Leucine-specific-binding protein precursor [Variovorax sp. PBL-E5]